MLLDVPNVVGLTFQLSFHRSNATWNTSTSTTSTASTATTTTSTTSTTAYAREVINILDSYYDYDKNASVFPRNNSCNDYRGGAAVLGGVVGVFLNTSMKMSNTSKISPAGYTSAAEDGHQDINTFMAKNKHLRKPIFWASLVKFV